MHRIRKMRESPNVPVSADYDPPSPVTPTEQTYLGTRPTHRHTNSGGLLGRLGGGGGGGGGGNRPSSDKPEPFVYIEANNKELPATPHMRNASPENLPSVGYLEGSNVNSSPGLARKTSLMKKVGRVVGRSRQ